MSVLDQYLKEHKRYAYDFATKNTVCKDGRPVISKDDEWDSETEWDDLFFELLENLTKEKK